MIDGIHELRHRPTSRLWYRQRHPSVRQVVTTEPAPTPLAPVPPPPPASTEPRPVFATARLRPSDREARGTAPRAVERMLADERPSVLTRVVKPKPAPSVPEWRVAPAGCPWLLLSATDLLDARRPGPVLGPGARYRLVHARNGVVGLEVERPGQPPAIGYCADLDLRCVEGEPRSGGFRGRSATWVKGVKSVADRLARAVAQQLPSSPNPGSAPARWSRSA